MTQPTLDPGTLASIRRELSQLAGGWDHFGKRISRAEQSGAIQQLLVLESKVEAWQTERQARDHNERRIEVDLYAKLTELDLEADRVQIAKVEVLIRAMEVAAAHPEIAMFSNIAERLSENLLVGPDVLAIEDQSEGE